MDHQVAGIPEQGLNRAGVLSAVAGLCGAQRQVAARLSRELGVLAASPDDWPRLAERLDHKGLAAKHLVAALREILDLPGNLALLRLQGGGFLLLRNDGGRWQTLNASGEVVADVPESAGDALTEGVVLRMPVVEPESAFRSFSAIWPALRAAWAEVGLASLFVNAGLLLLPLFSMIVYDKVVSNGVFETLWALTIGMLIYLLTDAGMRVVRTMATERISEDFTRRGDEGLWRRLVSQADVPSGFAKFLSHYRDLALARDFVSSTYLLALADFPFLLLYLLAIGLIAWPLVVVASLLVLVYAVAGLILQRASNRLGKEAEQQNTRKLAYMGEVLGALDVVRTVPGAGAFLRRWRELTDGAAAVDARRRQVAGHAGSLAAGMMTVSTVVMLVSGAYLIEARMLSVGGLIACNLLAARAMSLVSSLFMVMGKWQDFQRAAARMESVLDSPEPRAYTPRETISGSIAVIGLQKHYDGRPTVLDGVTLNVAPGARIALLGRPGAGKTTLLRCMAGLCRPDGGRILFDGLSLEDIDPRDRARWLAWKSQDPALFAGTLDENLRVAGNASDSARFERALWASGMEDELRSGRMTLGMQIDAHGANLSGGQRQKVALARVFAQSCRVLLLDEPTLGLDPDGERLLAERLPQLLGARDVLLMTTHSATMLGVAGRVVALENGRVIADGPREQLVRLG